MRRSLLSLFIAVAVVATATTPVGAQQRTACGYVVPEGYNLIQSNAAIIRGTTGPDFICAGNGRNLIRGKGGQDAIFGQGGNDVIYGGFGHDFLVGGAGDDRIIAGGGQDYVEAGSGNDVVLGGQGWDQLFGGPGVDRLTGGTGNDIVNGGDGSDRLVGNQGFDTLVGDVGNDVLWGGLGNDTLRGDSGNDTLIGGSQNDELDGGSDNDILRGADGNDSLISGHGDDLLEGGPGDDEITADFQGTKSIAGGPGVDACRGPDGFAYAEIGCEGWFASWFDSTSFNYGRSRPWLTVEHHVAGGPVPNGFVHVGVDNWDERNLNLDDDSRVLLRLHRSPGGPVIRSFTEDLEPVYNEYDNVVGQTFRKQMSAEAVRQGREVQVVGSTSKFTTPLEVHLTSATFDAATDSLLITGTPGKEVTVVARGADGAVVGVLHLPLDADGRLVVPAQDLPSTIEEIDVMRFNGYGNFEIFDAVVRNPVLVHELGSSVVGLSAPALDDSVEVTLHDAAGNEVASAVATRANGWQADFGTVLVVGQEIRANLAGRSGAKSLVIAELSLTDAVENMERFTVDVSGTGPAGWAIEGELFESFFLEIDDGLPIPTAPFETTVDANGQWTVEIHQSIVPIGTNPAGEIVGIDPDGDRLVLDHTWEFVPPE